MTEQQPPVQDEDVEGHGFRGNADAERDETDDTEGHGFRGGADAERDEDQDRPAR
jgi:hypothetical protein